MRMEIDKTLVTNDVGYRTVAKRFGISEQALFRHRSNHLPMMVAQALKAKRRPAPRKPLSPAAHAAELTRMQEGIQAQNERQAIDVMQQLRAINVACLEVLSKARAAGNHSTLLRAVDRIHRQIELQARLLGDLQDGQTVNVLVAPEWHQVRLVVVDALRPFPEARAAVAQALTALPPVSGADHAY
jgi:hypothetical protein